MEHLKIEHKRTLDDILNEAIALGINNIADAEEVYKKMIAFAGQNDKLVRLSNLAREYEEKINTTKLAA